jgi:hypothetical protein
LSASHCAKELLAELSIENAQPLHVTHQLGGLAQGLTIEKVLAQNSGRLAV